MGSADSSDERLGGLRLWLLLRVNRWLLTGAILFGVYVALVGGSQLGLAPFRQIAEANDGNVTLFTAFIGAIITGTSIVVTINQLVLSQELGSVGKQRDRMEGAIAFREDVEDTINIDPSPPEPAAFLYALVAGVEMRAAELESAVADAGDDELHTTIMAYVDDLAENAQRVKANLEDAQFGTFEVIWNALNFNYSRKIYDAREIRAESGAALSEDADERIDRVVETLRLFGPAREHFKTLYFQWELINVSRALLYISVPALAVMGLMIMYVDATVLPGDTFGVDNLVWLSSAGFVVGIAPFVVFMVYILRIATVAKRTLAMGPFILRESEREEDLE